MTTEAIDGVVCVTKYILGVKFTILYYIEADEWSYIIDCRPFRIIPPFGFKCPSDMVENIMSFSSPGCFEGVSQELSNVCADIIIQHIDLPTADA